MKRVPTKTVLKGVFFTLLLLAACVRIYWVLQNRGAAGRTDNPSYQSLLAKKGAKIVETDEYVLYLPRALAGPVRHPLVVALSPSADAWSMIRAWEPVVDKHQWLLYASKTVRNGVEYSNMFPQLIRTLKTLPAKYPVDASKVIATGLSGGGMASHFLAYHRPDLIAAVVINTGMMPEEQLGWRATHPRGKLAVFVASPTDFRYQEMKRDRLFLESLEWKTYWIEFEGGHTLAPSTTLEQAAQWLAEQFH